MLTINYENRLKISEFLEELEQSLNDLGICYIKITQIPGGNQNYEIVPAERVVIISKISKKENKRNE